MASAQDRRLRIPAGGLNLISPPDLTPAPDSLTLQNWRVDQAGALRSRKGSSQLAGGLPTPIHSLFRVREDRYGGCGTTLRKGTALATELATGFDGEPLGFAAYHGYTWVMNRGKRVKEKDSTATTWLPAAPLTAPTLALGAESVVAIAAFDAPEVWIPYELRDGNWATPGYVTDVLTAMGTVAVTNGAAAITGTDTSWTAGMTGKTIHIVGTLDGAPYDYYGVFTHLSATTGTIAPAYGGDTAAGLAHNITDSLAPTAFDTAIKVEGASSLLVRQRRVGRWRVERVAAQDWRVGGLIRGDDQFRFALWLEDTQTLTQIRVVVESSDGATAEAVIPAGYFAASKQAWHVLSIFRFDLYTRIEELRLDGFLEESEALLAQVLEIEQGLRDAPLQFVLSDPLRNVNWAAIAKLSIEIEAAEETTWRLDQAQMAGGAAATITGEVAYYVTYTNDDGHETNSGPVSASIQVRKRAVDLSAIPVSPDAGVTKKNIYRVGGGIDSPLRVAQIANATVTWSDTIDNATAKQDGIDMPRDVDPPPAASGLVGPYQGRLVAFNTAAHPNRIWYSAVDQPWRWPGADDDFEGNWDDVGEEGEPIRAATNHKRMLWIYKAKSIWRYTGDPDQTLPEQTNASVGAAGLKAVANAGPYDYFVGPEGVYRFNGDFQADVSVAIRPIFLGDYVEISPGISITPINPLAMGQCVLEYIHGRLYFSYPEAGQTTPNATLVYEESSQRWYQHKAGAGGYTALYHEGENQDMLGAIGGTLYRLEAGLTDAGAAIPLIWQSAYQDQGLPNHPKLYTDLVIEYRTAEGLEAPGTLQVKILFDNGAEIVTLGTISSTTRTTAIFPLGPLLKGRRGFNFAVRIEGDASSTCTIFAAYMHVQAEERVAKTFDSGVFDAGTARIKAADAIEFEYTAASVTNWALSGDLPDDLLSERRASTIPTLGGVRGVKRIQFVDQGWADVDARKFRLGLTGTAFQLHAARLRVLPIGLYLQAGQRWESEVLRYGARLQQLKDAVIEYQSASTATLQVWTDQPGGVMALRSSVTLAATSGWRVAPVPLDGIEGTLVQVVVIAGASPLKVQRGHLRLKEIGTYLDGSAGEVWESEAIAFAGVDEPLLIREAAIDLATSGAMTLEVYTDLPVAPLAVRRAAAVDTSSGRRTVNVRCPGSTQAVLSKYRLSGAATARIYGLRVYGRPLAGDWQWFSVPLIQTALEWSRVPLPIPETPLEPVWVNIPVDPIG